MIGHALWPLKEQLGGWLPMEWLLVILLIITMTVLYGTLRRRKIYRRIDALESWKIDIMNRPVTEEIARVKRLKMDGETEQKFETWRAEWDDIVTVGLPEAEEKLFEAEDAADKYRFQKASTILDQIHTLLENIESRVKALLQDLEELLSSEENNRKDIVVVKNEFHELKKRLLTERRRYQKAAAAVEHDLKNVAEQLEAYDQETEKGNYLEARSVLTKAKEEMEKISDTMNTLPDLLTDFTANFPEQLAELENGYQEMEKKGFPLEHLAVPEEIALLRQSVEEAVETLYKAEVEKPLAAREEIQERIDRMYEQLEYEALAKKHTRREREALGKQLEQTEAEIAAMKEETETVQKSYHIESHDLQACEEIEKTYEKLRKKFADTEQAFARQKEAYSLLEERLNALKERLATLQKESEQYREMLSVLREDEMKAKKSIRQLRKRLVSAKRMTRKSNLPGLPLTYTNGLDAAEEKIAEVEDRLRQTPLEMAVINRLLEEAKNEVDHCVAMAEKLVENALLAERVIQYGNRYRSRFADVAKSLGEAEQLFREYDYEGALERAAAAVERVEPGFLRRFDARIEEKV